VALYARNTDGVARSGLRASAVVDAPGVVVAGCRAVRSSGSSSSWECTRSDTGCDCDGSEYTQNLAPGETSPAPLLVVVVQLEPGIALAPIDVRVTFRDAAGLGWMDSARVPVSPSGGLPSLAEVGIRDDSDGDGELSPGETAWLDLSVRNGGTSSLLGLRASATVRTPTVAVTACRAVRRTGSSSSWACESTSAGCDCATSDHTQNLAPGETSPAPLLSVRLTLDPDAPAAPFAFDVLLADALGNTWPATAQVPVRRSGARVEVATAEIADDTDGDGVLSPGETATLAITPRNAGLGAALGLRAAAQTSSPRVTVGGCRAIRATGSSSTWDCEVAPDGCDCTASDYTQTLAPGQTAPAPLLAVTFRLASADSWSVQDAVVFDLRFVDALGNQWAQPTVLPVSRSAARLELAAATVREDDDGDGRLEPGESARVALFVRNTGSGRAVGVRASAELGTGDATITSCRAARSGGSSSTWSCERQPTACDCAESEYTQDIEPGAATPTPLLELAVTAAATTTGPVPLAATLEDALGNRWTEDVALPVGP
jgi:hypothetical protein